jgi:endonuclease I/V8-like Glu-specific endopeptidase
MGIDRFLGELQSTSERYERRSDTRAQTRLALDERGILHADDTDRVKKRLKRLNASWALARSVEGMSGPPSEDDRPISPGEPALYRADVLGLERLMGRNDLIEIGFLERGAIAARAVGRITAETAEGTAYGTGFLVSAELLLTNNHVLRSAEEAAGSYVQFNYQAGLDGLPLAPETFSLDPQRFFVTDEALDFTLVAVKPASSAAVELAVFGVLPLIEQEGKVILGEFVNVVQHPNGEPKQLALRENEVVDLLEDFLHYETDTSPGSSGSPVFNDQWEVVALHHSGVPKTDEAGNYVAIDGTAWEPGRGENEIAWVANEGVRVSRVLGVLRERELSGPAADLRAELLELARAPQPTTPAAPRAASWPVGPGPGALSVTVPMRMTVSLDPGTVGPVAAAAPLASASPAAHPEVQAALAEVDANSARPYYDQSADGTQRERYYAGVAADGDPGALYVALSELLQSTHVRPQSYKPMRHVYPWVDLHPDRELRSIYSGKTFEARELIEDDARIDASRSARLQSLVEREVALGPERFEAELATLEAEMPFNCEHVVPQSSFAKHEPMRGDLHHLFACESNCNSFRGNTPYFDFTDFEEVVRTDCGKREENRFEPSDGKGAVSRATLYFLLRYPGLIGDATHELQASQLPLLIEWHRLEPVGEWERHRNMAVEEIQGNRNPLIDHPEWATRIDFLAGFGQPA